VGQQPKKLSVRFKKLAWGSNQKNLPWGSKSYREAATKKLTVRFKNLPWCSKSYRGVQKVSVAQQPKKLTVGFKKLAWGSNQKNLPWGSKS
jgi:hypothetical protein